MEFRWRYFTMLLFLSLTLIIGGCASYTTQSLDTSRDHPLMVTQTTEKFKITAIPIITKEDGKRVFDRDDLNRKGLVPVFLSITNFGTSALTVRSVSLVDPQGNVSKQLSATEAAESVKKSVVGRAVGWLILTGGIGAIASAAHSASVNEKIVNDLTEKQFKMNPIPSKDTRTGYVYFEVPEKTTSLDGFKLVLEVEADDKAKIELPLKGEITGK